MNTSTSSSTPVASTAAPSTSISNSLSNVASTTGATLSSAATNVSQGVDSVSSYVKDSISSFQDSDLVGSSGSFLESNTLIAKFAFLRNKAKNAKCFFAATFFAKIVWRSSSKF